MTERSCELVCAWIDAYYTYRDEQIVALAHPEVVIRPRVGLGDRLYRGIDGLQDWLAFTRPSRSEIDRYSTVELDDGRVLAEAALDDMDVLALFEIRDDAIAAVSMYISDRQTLERLGEISTPRRDASTHHIGRHSNG